MNRQIRWQRAEPRPKQDLEFYNCIFDEKNGRYDSSKPHQHLVLESRRDENGICCMFADSLLPVFGMSLRDFTFKPKPSHKKVCGECGQEIKGER